MGVSLVFQFKLKKASDQKLQSMMQQLEKELQDWKKSSMLDNNNEEYVGNDDFVYAMAVKKMRKYEEKINMCKSELSMRHHGKKVIDENTLEEESEHSISL